MPDRSRMGFSGVAGVRARRRGSCQALPGHRGGTLFHAPRCCFFQELQMGIGTILLIILVIALLGGCSGIGGGPFYGTGYYGGGALGVIVIILLILVLAGRL